MKKTTGMNREITSKWRPATQAVRGGTWRSEHGETSEALFLSSGYTYDDAETVAARFAGEQQGMTYSRFMEGLTKAGVAVNRKMLSEIAIADSEGFKTLIEKARAALA